MYAYNNIEQPKGKRATGGETEVKRIQGKIYDYFLTIYLHISTYIHNFF